MTSEKFWGSEIDFWDAFVVNDELFRQAYEIISLVGAGYSVPRMWGEAESSASDINRHFGIVFGQMYELDLARKLVKLAVSTRALLDHHGEEFIKKFLYDLPPCGTLHESGKDNTLSFRNALNKIIHAKKIVFERESFGAEAQFYMAGDILYGFTGRTMAFGSKGASEWKANIDILSLCDGVYITLTPRLDFPHGQWRGD